MLLSIHSSTSFFVSIRVFEVPNAVNSQILHIAALIKHHMVTFILTSRGMSDLFGNGFAVEFVVDFPDLGHGESGDRECI